MYTIIEQNEDKTYSIKFSPKFYEIFTPMYRGDSYFNILYRLFDLLPQDFYHMLGTNYNATFIPSKFLTNFIHTVFKNKQDCINFANEIDKRIKYFVARADFT